MSICCCELEWYRAGRTDDGSGGVAVSVGGATGRVRIAQQLSGSPSGALYRIALVVKIGSQRIRTMCSDVPLVWVLCVDSDIAVLFVFTATHSYNH